MLDQKIRRHIDGQNKTLLVIGAPGTGKTYNLTRSIEYLIKQKDIYPGRILVFCFNRRWSKAIREEIALIMDTSFIEIPVETFFSFSKDLVSYASMRSFEGPYGVKVPNSTKQWEILSDIIKGLTKKDYPKTTSIIESGSHTLKSFLQEVFDFILRSQENLLSPVELSNRFTPFFDQVLSEMTGIYSKYVKRLEDENRYNYGRILTEAVRYLEEDKAVRDHFRDSYDYILVDELNEVNAAQLRILRYISKNRTLMFGNDDQSIYSFRGSMVDNFRKVYEGLDEKDIVFLDRDHRSHNAISYLCQAFIEKNNERIKKPPSRTTIKKDLSEIIISEIDDSLGGLEILGDKIIELRDNKKIGLHQMCILVKGVGYQAKLLEDMLRKKSIPFQKRGTRNILEDTSVSYLLDLSRLIYLESRDNDSVVQKKVELLENVLLAGRKDIDPILVKELKKTNIFKKQVEDLDEIDRTGLLRDIMALIEEFKERVNEPVYTFMVSLFMRDIYLDCKDGLDLFEDQQLLNDNLSDFFESLKRFCTDNEEKNSLLDYLDFLESLSRRHFIEEIEESTESVQKEGRLNLMSFHQCKGLEFEAVFIPFMNADYLPAKFYYPQTYDMQIFRYFTDEELMGKDQLAKRHIEEERKLFYTGITRAKRYLHITCLKDSRRSVFFDELKKIASSQARIDQRLFHILDQRPLTGKPWQLRKKADIYSYRITKGLKIDIEGLLNDLYMLFETYHPDKWYRNIKETKNDQDILKKMDFVFSYSSLDTYRECPAKFKYRYILRIEEKDKLAMGLGKAYHKILSKFISGKKHSWPELKEIIEEAFKEIDFGFDGLKKEHESEAIKNLRAYFERWMPENPGRSLVEKKFYMDIGSDRITGRIDQINFLDDETIEVVDLKSASTKMTKKALLEEIQLRLYKSAILYGRGLEDLKGRKIKLKYHYLSDPKRPSLEIPEEGQDMEDFLNTIREIISSIKSEMFEPDRRDRYKCSRCDYSLLCGEQDTYGQ